jgi:FAD/FMN-containing dehydrogenase
MRFAERLADIVGPANVLTSPADSAPYLTDWRRQYSSQALCVVKPASTAEVASVVRACAAEGVAVVPQGGNTGLCGGSVPSGLGREIVLSLARMNRIREIDVLNQTMTVEAGCVLSAVRQAASDAGRLFPLSLAAEGSCQLGGNLSTNAGGVNVLRYGMAREQVLGIEVVLPDARVWNGLRGLRKDNTGYDLKQLFLGAEGTLGVITAAVLRLHPMPTATTTAWIGLDAASRAVELLALLGESVGDRLSAFELISRDCLQAVLEKSPNSHDPLPAPHPWYVLAEFCDGGDDASLVARVEEALSRCVEGSVLQDAVLAQSRAQARALWAIRELIPEAQFTGVKHDISVPISKIAEFIELVGAELRLRFPQAKPYVFGHVGDGNLHYNVGPPGLLAEREAVNAIVYEIVAKLGGSISAEHGLGQLKREEILLRKDPLELELMANLKRVFDPRQIMNPGKVLSAKLFQK